MLESEKNVKNRTFHNYWASPSARHTAFRNRFQYQSPNRGCNHTALHTLQGTVPAEPGRYSLCESTSWLILFRTDFDNKVLCFTLNQYDNDGSCDVDECGNYFLFHEESSIYCLVWRKKYTYLSNYCQGNLNKYALFLPELTGIGIYAIFVQKEVQYG